MLPATKRLSRQVLLFAVLFLAASLILRAEQQASAQSAAMKASASQKAPASKAAVAAGTKAAGSNSSKAAVKHDYSAKTAMKKGSKVFLWKVTSDSGATVYLLGTIHVFRRDFYPLPDEIEKALDKSKVLLLEVALPDKPEKSSVAKNEKNAVDVKMNESDEEETDAVSGEKKVNKDKSKEKSDETNHEILTESLAKCFYPRSDSLANHISKTTLALLQRYCASLDVPEAKYLRMKAWFAAFYIEYFELARLGFYAKMGIDEHLSKEAKEKGKKVLGLETKGFHEDVTAGISDELQDKMLKQILLGFEIKPKIKPTEDKASDAKAAPHEISPFEAWMKGDEKGMLSMVMQDEKKHPDMGPVQNRILYDRNDTMLEALEPYLRGNETSMVAVGSAHLVGEKGLVAQLKQKGYKVSQVVVGDEI